MGVARDCEVARQMEVARGRREKRESPHIRIYAWAGCQKGSLIQEEHVVVREAALLLRGVKVDNSYRTVVESGHGPAVEAVLEPHGHLLVQAQAVGRCGSCATVTRGRTKRSDSVEA